MNNEHNQAIFDLVTEYENMIQRGLATFFDEKDYLKLVDYYEEEGLFERALEVVEQALKNHQYSADFYIRKAQLLLDTSREELALDVLEQAAVFAPGEADIFLLRAEALAYLNQTDEAFAILEDLKQTADQEEMSDIFVVEATIYENLEQFEQMFFSLKAALQENPRHKEALERIWLCVELSKNYEESINIHEEILDADPYSYLAWYNLGHAHSYLGHYEEAIEAYEFAYVINEKFEYAYRDCAEMCFELKLYHKALKCYLEILENFEPESEVLLRVGQCYQNLENYKTARKYYQDALRLDPLDDEVHFQIGECYACEEKWKSAIVAFRKAISIEDNREEYYAAIGNAYFRSGDLEKAEPNFRLATELASEESSYWIQYAGFLMDTGRGEEALLLLDEADLYAVGADLQYCRVACLFRTGRRQEAFYRLGEALIEDFGSHSTLFDLIPELERDPAVLSLISTYHE
jgi:tetratricopeptide (TPR) repeat protein